MGWEPGGSGVRRRVGTVEIRGSRGSCCVEDFLVRQILEVTRFTGWVAEAGEDKGFEVKNLQGGRVKSLFYAASHQERGHLLEKKEIHSHWQQHFIPAVTLAAGPLQGHLAVGQRDGAQLRTQHG